MKNIVGDHKNGMKILMKLDKNLRKCLKGQQKLH